MTKKFNERSPLKNRRIVPQGKDDELLCYRLCHCPLPILHQKPQFFIGILYLTISKGCKWQLLLRLLSRDRATKMRSDLRIQSFIDDNIGPLSNRIWHCASHEKNHPTSSLINRDYCGCCSNILYCIRLVLKSV